MVCGVAEGMFSFPGSLIVGRLFKWKRKCMEADEKYRSIILLSVDITTVL